MEDFQQNILRQNSSDHSSDEIDLYALFKKIWDGRLLIAGIVLVSAMVAFIALKMTTSYYRIESTIDKVDNEELRPLYPTILEGKDYKVADGKLVFLEYQVSIPDGDKIYNEILLKINTLGMLKEFWEKHTGKTLDLRRGAKATEDSAAFKKFQKSFLLDGQNLKIPTITARKISFEYQDPSEGAALLNKYFDFVNQQLWAAYFAKMEANFLSSLQSLEISYKTKQMIETRKLNDELIVWRESLKIAESLGIKETPYKELENIQSSLMNSRQYLLGTKPLTKQIEILVARQSGSLSPYSPELRKMETWREQMTQDLQRIKTMNEKIHLFAIINPPESSLDPIKPQKMLIFIAVIFLSGLFSIAFVLIKSTLKNRNSIAN